MTRSPATALTPALALALTLLTPALALAGPGCDREKTRQSAAACAEGTIRDAATGNCLPLTTS